MANPTKYWVVVETLEEQIARMGPNTLLPTEQQLARRFEVSRITIRRALSFLERKGVLSRERGRGTIVNSPKVTRHLVPVSPIEQDLLDQGLKLETRIARWQPRVDPPDPIRARLRLTGCEPVACLSLVRLVDDQVICHDERHFPLPPGKQFIPELISTRAVSQVLEDLWGLKMASDTWETEITPASREVATFLGVVPGVLAFVNTFTHYLEDGRPAETGVMSYRIDRVKFQFSTADMATWQALGRRKRRRPLPPGSSKS